MSPSEENTDNGIVSSAASFLAFGCFFIPPYAAHSKISRGERVVCFIRLPRPRRPQSR